MERAPYRDMARLLLVLFILSGCTHSVSPAPAATPLPRAAVSATPVATPAASEGGGLARETSATPWSRRPVLLLGIGDSVTRGFGATPGRSYFELLARGATDDPAETKGVPLEKVFPRLEVRNLAVNSSVSAQHLQAIEQLPPADKAVLGWVVMTSGGNDILHNYGRTPPREDAMYGATLVQARPWIEAYRQRLEKMVDILDSRFPGGCQVFVATIYDPTDGVGDIENAGLGLPAWPEGLQVLAAANEAIRSLARHPNVHVVDMRAEFLGHGIHHGDVSSRYFRKDDPSYWYYANLEDPNDLGYAAIRRLFLNSMVGVARHLEQ